MHYDPISSDKTQLITSSVATTNQTFHLIAFPMDHQSYISIIANRGDIPSRDLNGVPYALSAFRQDLMSNKAVWINHYRKDLVFALNNKHSVISIFGVVRHHPLTRCHRFILFLCSVCLSVLSSAIVTTLNVNRSQNGMPYLKLMNANNHGVATCIWLSLLSAFTISIYNGITKQCLLCSCFDSTSCSCFESIRIRRFGRCFCKSIGFAMAIYIQTFNAICYLMIAIAILTSYDQNTRHFWSIWILSSLCAYLIEVIWIWIYFHRRWTVEHKLQSQGLLQEKLDFNVTFDEFESWNQGNYLDMSLSSSLAVSEEEEEWSPRNINRFRGSSGHLQVFLTSQRL